MKFFSRAALCVVAGVLTFMPVMADESVPLEPSSKWTIEYADAECQLVRTFGTSENQILLRIGRGDAFDISDMVMSGPHLKKQDFAFDAKLAFAPQTGVLNLHATYYRLDSLKTSVFRVYHANIHRLAFSENDQILKFTPKGSDTVSLNAKGLRSGLAALKTCHDDLLASWGIDLAHMAKLKEQAKPIGEEYYWASFPKDLPQKLQKMEMQWPSYLLNIGADGKPTKCSILSSSGNKEVDDAVCPLVMERAKFTPAIAADGTPTHSFYMVRIPQIRRVIISG